MSSSYQESSSDKRAQIRLQQREAWSAVYRDPLANFASSDTKQLRSVSAELAEHQDRIKEKIRAVSGISLETLGPYSPSRAQQFVKKR